MLSPADIIAEHRLGRTPHQAAIDWLGARGVPPMALARSYAGEFTFVNLDDVVFLDGGAFEFGRYCDKAEPEPALTILARDVCGDACDIVAWAANANRIATWLGRAALLGEDELWRPRLSDGLAVHAGMLPWLQAHRCGVVILDKLRAAPLLRETGTLMVSSMEQGRTLRKMLELPPPCILVPASRQMAA